MKGLRRMQRLQAVKYSKRIREEYMRMERIHRKRSGRKVLGIEMGKIFCKVCGRNNRHAEGM